MSVARAMRRELEKLAEQTLEQQLEQPEPVPPPPARKPHPVLSAAKHLGVFGAGVLGGQLAGMGLNAASERLTGAPLVRSPAAMVALPVVTGAGALLFNAWQSGLMDQLRDEAAARRKAKYGG